MYGIPTRVRKTAVRTTPVRSQQYTLKRTVIQAERVGSTGHRMNVDLQVDVGAGTN